MQILAIYAGEQVEEFFDFSCETDSRGVSDKNKMPTTGEIGEI